MDKKEKKEGQKKYWQYLTAQYEKRQGQDLETPLFAALEVATQQLKKQRIADLGERPKPLPKRKTKRKKKKK